MALSKPAQSEYHEFYETYISKVPDGIDVTAFLEDQRIGLISTFENLPSEKQNYKYADGKWSIKELLRHIIDAESLFAYRAFTISKKTGVELAGMDQDDYMDGTNDSENSFQDLIEEFDLQRRSNIRMIQNIHDNTFEIIGNANGTPVSVRANVYIIAGHTEHHLEVLKERYL